MIGWYCNVGVVNTWPPTKLDDVNFLDINVPYVIPEIDMEVGSSAIVFENISNDELIGKLEGYIGDQTAALYADHITGYKQSNIGWVLGKRYIPSFNLSYKNTWAYAEGKSGIIPTMVYFPQFRKGIVQRSWSVGDTYCVNVGEDGSIQSARIGATKQYVQTGTSNREDFLFFFVRSYQDGDNLGEKNKVCVIDGWLNNLANSSKLRIVPFSPSWTGFPEMFNFLFGTSKPEIDVIKPPNPYEPGGPSGPTDPDLPPGTFDDESDPIPDSPLPTLSAANTGFTRIYNPTLSQVQALARYLWTDPDVIQTIWNHIKQFFEDPMEAIIGFNLVPVPVPDGGIENFALMYIDTGVQMTVAANQFVDLDCGTLELKRYYGSALDQSPYTKVSCYLPYIGTVNLNTDEVMGTTLQVKYRVDIVSGSCVAKIFVDGNCLYQYSGHCAITIPISSADFSSYVSAAISVGKLAAAAITAGAGAAMAAGVGEVAQQTNQIVTTTQTTSTARNPATGRQITTGTTTTVQTRESPADQSSTQASFSGLSPQNVANTVGAIMSSKPHIEHSGSFSGNSGYLGVRRPFVIIERPNMCMPANYQALNGFPAMITMELSTCKGFTRVQQVQLTGLHATNPEQAEILELLKSGVIL